MSALLRCARYCSANVPLMIPSLCSTLRVFQTDGAEAAHDHWVAQDDGAPGTVRAYVRDQIAQPPIASPALGSASALYRNR